MSLRPILLALRGLRLNLGLDGETSVRRMMWRGSANQIGELFTGGTDQADEDRAEAIYRDAHTADELAWLILNVRHGQVFAAPALGWAGLDDELEGPAIDRIARRLTALFDRRDYLPWRLVHGGFASSIRAADGGAAHYLLEAVGERRWRDQVADFALRGALAENIGDAPGIAGDRAALGELARAADRLSGDDARRVRRLHALCACVDRAFRDVAAGDVGALVDTVDRVIDASDPAVRDGGLAALAFLGNTTVNAMRIAAREIGERVAESGMVFIRGVLQRAGDVAQHRGPIADALDDLRRELEDMKRRIVDLGAAFIQVSETLRDLDPTTSEVDDRAVTAVGILADSPDEPLQWLPTEWKIKLCRNMLLVGGTEDPDEEAILSILRSARSGAELFHIYAGCDHSNLEDNLDGTENNEFYAVIDRALRRHAEGL